MLRPIAMPDLRQRTRGTYTARIKIPRDVATDYAATCGQKWSAKKTWQGLTEEQARLECTNWGNTIAARIKALRAARQGHHQTLNHKEIHGLVGVWYMEFVAKYENNPAPAESYEAELAALEFEEEAGAGIDLAPIIKADAWLLDHGYALTPESRRAFLDALALRYIDALTLLAKRARGDFSRDPIQDTFPTLEPAKAGVPLTALWDQWCGETKPANGTTRRWKPIIDAAAARWPDIKKATESDARTWFKSLVTETRSAYTVNTIWRTALKTVCNWAIGQGLLSSNPFANIKVSVPRKPMTRESKAFNDDEARTILSAALVYNEPGALRDAKRWLPWLCAYSGARAGEVAQLRGQDVKERDDIWAMTLTPEAGTIKDGKPRTVPLHADLIEQGFLEFVKARGDGPLFHNRSQDQKRVRHVVQKVGEWVRALGINDPEIRPNHAWRHLFKLKAERANIPERLSDVITGHSPASIGRAYGQPTLADLAREIEKFPRYKT